MTIDVLMMLLFAALTIIAYMIAINAKGIWRLALSFLLATCMLGGTVWLVILQLSADERSRFEARTDTAETSSVRTEELTMSDASRAVNLIAHANGFAAMLYREKLMDEALSRDQLVKRAIDTEQRLEALNADINNYKHIFENYPETQKLVNDAIAKLKEACRLYRKYYFAENTREEQLVERQMRQHARDAHTLLTQAEAAMDE